MSEVLEPFKDFIEFIGVLFVALLVQNSIYKSLIRASAGAVFSAVGSYAFFVLVILAYYEKIRAYVRAKFKSRTSNRNWLV